MRRRIHACEARICADFNHVRQGRLAAGVHDWSTQGNTPSVAALLGEAECARRSISENVLHMFVGTGCHNIARPRVTRMLFRRVEMRE